MSKKNAAAAPVDDYETSQDLHHLTQAHKIKSDPPRHKKAMALARQRIHEMQAATSMSPTDAAADTDKDGM